MGKTIKRIERGAYRSVDCFKANIGISIKGREQRQGMCLFGQTLAKLSREVEKCVDCLSREVKKCVDC